MRERLAAVIFDLDGVVVDSEPLHYRAFQEVLNPQSLGYSWARYVERYIGFDDRDAFRVVYEEAGIGLDEQALRALVEKKALAFRKLVQQEPTPSYPGVAALIGALNGRKPLALCTGSLRCDFVPLLEKLGLTLAFDVAVAADDVEKSKPDPEPYRLALRQLARAFPEEPICAERCVAIEDTPAGVRAARQAGVAVLAVTHTHPADVLSEATAITETLEGVTVDDLNGLLVKRTG